MKKVDRQKNLDMVRAHSHLLTLEKIAEATGVHRHQIQDYMHVLSLPEVDQRRFLDGDLTFAAVNKMSRDRKYSLYP